MTAALPVPPADGTLTQVPIGTFTTEAGVTLPEVTVAVQRWGEFNEDKTNIILIQHALTGDSNAAGPVGGPGSPETGWWQGLIGPRCVIDTNKYAVICTNTLGGCQGTTGPSSLAPDGQPWGARFPALSIRDLVACEEQLLRLLGISRIVAVIGGSMGGARALEWAIMYPAMVTSSLPICVSPRASAWQIGIQTAQILAIESDPQWADGQYYTDPDNPGPIAGLGQARKIAHLTYRGEREIDARFGAASQPGEDAFGPYRARDQRFMVNGYLDHQANKLVERFDAGSYVVLTEALNRHDIGRERGGMEKTLARLTVPTMFVGIDTDILYPLHQQEWAERHLGNSLGLREVTTDCGHDGFLIEFPQVAGIIKEFIAAVERRTSDWVI